MNILHSAIQQDQLNHLLTLLQQSLQGVNVQENFATFKQLQSNPQSYLYFLAVLINPLLQEDIKQLSGLTLKNMIKRNIQNLQIDTLNLIKQVIFQQYDQQTGKVLKTLGLIMGVIVEKMKFDKDTLNFLLQKANQGNIFAIQSLKRIVQDFRLDSQNMSLINSQQFAHLAEKLVGILIPQCTGPNKQHAIDCFNMLIYPMPISLVKSLHQFIEIIKMQIFNSNVNVSLKSMQGLEAIASTRKDLITQQIIQRVASCKFVDHRIKKIEANFWIQVLDSQSEEFVKSIIHLLLPKVILGLTLTNQDIANLMQLKKFSLENDGEDQEQDNEGSDNEMETAQGGDFTLRKRCGMIVTKLSIHFYDQLWELSKNYIIDLIKSTEWEKHQIAILFLGLIKQNCEQSIQVNSGEIISMISNIMNNSKQYLLKSTSLWTLSQYTKFIVKLASNDPTVLSSYINLILLGMKDDHSNVRSAACTSLSSLIEDLQNEIIPWLTQIFQITSQALQVYKGNSLYCLFQFYATLAESIDKSNFTQSLVDQIIIPLCQKWNNLGNNDSDICPLIECLVSLCQMGKNFTSQYTMQLFKKTVGIFQPKFKQIFIRAVDLIQVLISNSSENDKIEISQSGLLQKTLELINMGQHEVKQACYSLLSVIVEHIGVPLPGETISCVLNSINMAKTVQINNALFCILQIIIKYPDVKDNISVVAKISVQNLLKKQQKSHFMINFSKLVGTLGFYHSEAMIPYLKSVFAPFCFSMKASNEHNRKYHLAIAGMFKMIELKSQDILQNFKCLVDLGICMKNVPEQNQKTFTNFLRVYKQRVGEHEWSKFLDDSNFLPGAINKINSIVNY